MAHRAMDAEQSHSVPHVSIDYSFLGQDDQKVMPVALVRDHASKTTFSHVVPHKGIEAGAYPARQVAFSISQLGHKKLVFKSDNEPAMLALKAEATKLLRSTYGIEVICEESVSYTHLTLPTKA